MPVLCRITTCLPLPRNSTVLPFTAGSAWIRPAAGRSVTGSCSFSGIKTARWSLRLETPNKTVYSTAHQPGMFRFSIFFIFSGDVSHGFLRKVERRRRGNAPFYSVIAAVILRTWDEGLQAYPEGLRNRPLRAPPSMKSRLLPKAANAR